MKTIILRRNSTSSILRFPDIINVPDSAVSRDWRPVFLPDDGSPWLGQILPAYRVCRLGKNIPERFATRYFDAVTLAVVAFPAENSIPLSLASTADGFISLGKWIDLPEPERGKDTIHIGSHANFKLDFSDKSSGICNALHTLSRCMTLKMGDIIIPFDNGISVALDINTEISATLDGMKVLEYRVK